MMLLNELHLSSLEPGSTDVCLEKESCEGFIDMRTFLMDPRKSG